MPRAPAICGTHRQSECPVWQPLVDLAGEEVAACFMWMFEVELESGTRVHAYKHRWTRWYVHLSDDGRAFRCSRPGRYVAIDAAHALGHALVGTRRPDGSGREGGEKEHVAPGRSG